MTQSNDLPLRFGSPEALLHSPPSKHAPDVKRIFSFLFKLTQLLSKLWMKSPAFENIKWIVMVEGIFSYWICLVHEMSKSRNYRIIKYERLEYSLLKLIFMLVCKSGLIWENSTKQNLQYASYANFLFRIKNQIYLNFYEISNGIEWIHRNRQGRVMTIRVWIFHFSIIILERTPYV